MTILETHSTKSQHSSKCPGTGCMDQGCPAHYADSTNLITNLITAESESVAKLVTNLITPEPAEVVKLVEALEGLLAIIDESLGVSGYHLNGAMAKWCEFDEVEMAEEALALYRQQRR